MPVYTYVCLFVHVYVLCKRACDVDASSAVAATTAAAAATAGTDGISVLASFLTK